MDYLAFKPEYPGPLSLSFTIYNHYEEFHPICKHLDTSAWNLKNSFMSQSKSNPYFRAKGFEKQKEKPSN